MPGTDRGGRSPGPRRRPGETSASVDELLASGLTPAQIAAALDSTSRPSATTPAPSPSSGAEVRAPLRLGGGPGPLRRRALHSGVRREVRVLEADVARGGEAGGLSSRPPAAPLEVYLVKGRKVGRTNLAASIRRGPQRKPLRGMRHLRVARAAAGHGPAPRERATGATTASLSEAGAVVFVYRRSNHVDDMS